MDRPRPSTPVIRASAPGTGPVAALAGSVPAALLCLMLVLAYAVADAVLLFGTAFPEHLSAGLGMALVGGAVVAGVMAIGSHLHGTIAGTQAVTLVMLASLVADVRASFPPGAEDAFPTAVAAVLVATTALGIAYLLAARLRLGRFVHYVPRPVVAGLLGGSGLALVLVALPVLTGRGGLEELARGFAPGEDLPGLALGAIAAAAFAFAARRRTPQVAFVATVALGYVAWRALMHLAGLDPEAARAGGWTLSSVPQAAAWPPPALAGPGSVDWSRVVDRLPFVGAVVIVTLVAMLVKVGAVAQMLDRDVDESRELRAAGAANLAAACAIGLPGFHTVGLTRIAWRMRASHRGTGLLLALLVVAALPFAGSILVHAPRFLVGGMLLWVGADLAATWLFGLRDALSRLELGTVVAIAATILAFGFLPGLLVGLGCALVLFAFDCARVDALRAAVPAADLGSNVDRTAAERERLAAHAHELLVLRLHGFLFFGTAHRLVEQLRDGLDAARTSRHVVVDLERVTGLDGSALHALERLCALARRRDLTLAFSAVPAARRDALDALIAAQRGPEGSATSVFDTLDEALQAREEALLDALDPADRSDRERLTRSLGREAVKRLAGYADTCAIEAGRTLLRAGRPAGALYLVREGRLSVRLAGGACAVRVRGVGPGALLGELSLYLGRPASADIVAETRCRFWRFTPAALERLLEDDPALAFRFQRYVTATLAERLLDNGRQIRILTG